MPSCTNCGADWSQGKWTEGCPQCGGFAMQTPCLLCGGRCGGIWYRSVHDSQDSNLAHWGGGCKLPMEEQKALMAKLSKSS
jgi:hypothetical protein